MPVRDSFTNLLKIVVYNDDRIVHNHSERHNQRRQGDRVKLYAERIKKAGRHARIEGLPAADWVLIDAEDVIVHLFRPEVRSFYNLERMWSFGDAPEVASA